MVRTEILCALLCAMGLFLETLCSFTMEAEVGESVTIWCQHKLTVSGSIFWFKHTTDSVPLLLGCKKFRTSENCYFFKDTERLVMSVQSENTSLTITALNISDTGLYYCSSMDSGQVIFRNSTYLHVRGVNKTVPENKETGCFSATRNFVLNVVFGSVVVILLSVLTFILLKHKKTHGGAETEDHEGHDSVNYGPVQQLSRKTNRTQGREQIENLEYVYTHVVYKNLA